MADYVIDWNGTSPGTGDDVDLDGTTTLFDGNGNQTEITVATPSGGSGFGEEWTLTTSIGDADGELRASNVNDPTEATIQFESAMTDITFELYDIDSRTTGPNSGRWDDQVKVYALDEYGNPYPTAINVTDQASHHSVTNDGTTYTIDTNGNDNAGVEGSGAEDSVTVTIPGPVYGFVIIYDNGAGHPTSGVVGIGPVSFDDPSIVVPCFTRGTMIATDRGEVAIEDLACGDMVRTADHGMQPIRWIGSTSVAAVGRRAPVLIRKGALGNTSDLLVSPAHRMMLHSWQTELLFDAGEMLVAAQSLVNDSSIIRQVGGAVEYFHILFDSHEIVFANGIPSESFHPGEASVGTMAAQAREEIYALFPQLAESETSYGPSARQTMMPHEAALLSL